MVNSHTIKIKVKLSIQASLCYFQNKKFKNCNEEQIFDAVLCYCKSKSDSGATFDNLVPGLYKSCGAYLKYIQSVPRTLTLKTPRK